MIATVTNPAWVFVVVGVCAGLIGGALGLGGGTIIVPALVLICGFAQKSAQGTALAVMMPMALLGAFRYWRNPDIEMNALPVGLIICGALAGVLIGTEVASRLPGHILRKIFAVVLVIIGIRMFITPDKSARAEPDSSITAQKNVTSLEHGQPDVQENIRQ
jgi:hypothetical protein